MSTLSLRKIKHDSSAVDNITLDSSGRVGVNQATPNVPLEVGGSWRLGTNTGGSGSGAPYAGGLGGGFNPNNNIYSMYCRDRTDTYWNDLWIEGKTISLKPGGNYALTADNSGRVTKPNQPCFMAVPSSSYGISGNTAAKINFNSTMFNNGGYYNTTNQRFTAPVSGYYLTIVHAYIYGGSYDANVYVYKNGASYVRGQSYNGSTTLYGSNPGGATLSTIMYLNATDYVEGWYSLNDDGRATNIYNGQNVTRFEMYLLG